MLEGAPALVMAVDRRAQVRLEPRAQPPCLLRAPGIIADTAAFTVRGDGSLAWEDTPSGDTDQLPLVAQLLQTLVRQGLLNPSALPSFAATLLTQSFFQPTPRGDHEKLGLGSSAALTVALASALSELAGVRHEAHDSGWFAALVEAHRALQGGHGSGLDIAASLFGGLLDYRLRAQTSEPQVRELTLPDGIAASFVWTGRGASTHSFLHSFARWKTSAPAQWREIMQTLSAIAESGAEAAREHDSRRLLEAVSRYAEALRVLGAASKMTVFSAEHSEIAALAGSLGLAYKPCGAGGGDIGVAVSLNRKRLRQFEHAVGTAGYTVVALRIEDEGVKTQRRVA
ncbi:MAG: hypothetical protein GWN34_19695 [Gammaproteobacteria bacterium]|nr:hypothetical protein [Gammaproteobacteria bacterium]